MTDPQPFVDQFGEQRRAVVEDALRFLDESLPRWDVMFSDRERMGYVGAIVAAVVIGMKALEVEASHEQ